jgi:hypothetical protein
MSVPIADFGVNGKFPSSVGGTGTTVKYFPRNVAYTAGATWVASPSTPSSSKGTGCLLVPGDGKLNGQLFTVKACGDFLQAATESSSEVTVALYAVTGNILSSPTYTQLAITAAYANAADAVSYPWALECTLFGDTASGIVGGSYTPWVAGVLGTRATTTNVLTSIDFNAGNSLMNFAPFGLVVGVTFGQSFAANAANLYQFVIEA